MNHSVVQSTFESPCVQSGDTALFSGFFPVTGGMGPESWTVKINDTKPIWLYCSQGPHCQLGMAAVINPQYVTVTLLFFFSGSYAYGFFLGQIVL
jgi:hypothetical protein